MIIDKSINISPFEYFLLRFFDQHPSDLYLSLYFHFLCYLSIDRFDIFCLPFLRSLNVKQKLPLISKLPDCKSVFTHLMELLQETEESFLIAFDRLFKSFGKIPTTLLPFFNLCFRNALKKSLLVSNINAMLAIISKIPENSYHAYDFFFSAFTTDHSIIQNYVIDRKNCISIQINPKYHNMPISFLKFLTLSRIDYIPHDSLIWSFFQTCPLLTFELISLYPEKVLYDIWKLLITKAQSLSIFQDIHFKIYYYFLLSSINHPQLMSLFKSLKLRFLINDLIFEKNQSNLVLSEKNLAFLSLYLLFCRLNEKISEEFITISDYQSKLTSILSNKDQFKSFINFFVWVLNPTNEFPMEGVNYSESNNSFALLPPPSFTFSSKIAPFLLSLVMRTGISDHFDEPSFAKLIDTVSKIFEWEKTPSNFLFGLTDENVLKSLIPFAMKSDKYFYLLTSALSISCLFPVFSNVYSLIAHDDQKLLKFLISVSSTAPLVNDFLRIDNKHKLNFSCMNGTVAMWVRFLNQPAQIMRIKFSSNAKVYVKREENTFILEVCGGISRFIPMNDDIGGWYLIIIELKPKTITMSVNLAQVKIDYLFGQSAVICLGKSTSLFDLQSLHFFRSELSHSNICRLFTLGPNYKTNYIENFLSINYEPLFVLKNNFISSLYIQWISSFHNKNLTLMPPLIDSKNSAFNFNALFNKNYEFGISPPYGQFYTNQKVQESDKTSPILKKRLYFESFFNSLDAHGGISLLIHFLVEIILKKRELHFLAFSLFNILVNRFPFIHYYFEENKVYQLIGQILWKSSPETKSIFQCAMIVHNNSDNCIISNVNVVKYWLFGPSLFYSEYYDLILKILTSLEGEFAEDNLTMLEIADCFNSIIKSISNSDYHSEKFLSILMALALKLTNQNNAQKHASIIMKYLLVYHFKAPINANLKCRIHESNSGEVIQSDKIKESNKTKANIVNENSTSTENTKTNIGYTNTNDACVNDDKINTENTNVTSINDDKINIENTNDTSVNDDKINTNSTNTDGTSINNNDIQDAVINNISGEIDGRKVLSNESNKTVSLIHLLSQILFNYGKTTSISLKPLLPMFLNSSTPVLNSLYDLMMKYLHPQHHTEFIITLTQSISNTDFSDYIYSYSTSFIFKSNGESNHQFYHITIPLFYLLAQERKEEKIFSIFSSSATLFDGMDSIPTFVFDHVYRLLYELTKMKKMSYFFGHEVNSNSIQITPFCHFLLKLLVCAFFNNQSTESVKSFIHSFFALDHGNFSIFVVSYFLDRLTDYQLVKNSQDVSDICCDLFYNISFILRERKMNPPPYISFFIQNSCNFIDYFSTSEILSSFVSLLNEISCNSSTIALSITSIISECAAIKSLSNYKEIMGMLESPMMAVLNSKKKKNPFKIDYKNFLNVIQKVDENEINCFLALYCDSILKQTLFAHSIYTEQEGNDEILLKWREIFTKLNFPGSRIYSNCPIKYKVDDSTIRYQVRRVLLPLNPSLDAHYLNHWDIKYSKSEGKPLIRLRLSDVFDGLNYSHNDDILFTSESSRLYGTSIIHGFFVVTKKTIKFYGENDLLLFNVGKIHSIRLIDYQHQPIGIFIYEKDEINPNSISNSTMFAFKSRSLRSDFVANIEKNFELKVDASIEGAQLSSVTHSWSKGRITNLEYLLYLNFLSGRTWSDLTRYPIFPWVCLDFSKSGPVLRDLKYPFFAQTEEQKQACLKYYRMTLEVPDEAPHYYSNYVSNVGSALYFLVRLEPFTTEEIEYQGGSLDSADRSFQSFSISAEVMTHPGEKSTLELVPEVYFLPDFLVNVNGIKFPKSPIKSAEIGDVKLPCWSKNQSGEMVELSPFKFVRKMRKILESEAVSKYLNDWIDLVWGVRRSGPLADERLNVFSPIIYRFDHNKYSGDQKLMNAFSSLMHNCGQAPLQLFDSFHPKKHLFPVSSPISSRKLELLINGRIENKRPRIDELLALGFDTRKRDKQTDLFSVDKSIIFSCGSDDSFCRISVHNSSIDVEKIEPGRKNNKSTVYFANEIEPVLICASHFDHFSAKINSPSAGSASSSSAGSSNGSMSGIGSCFGVADGFYFSAVQTASTTTALSSFSCCSRVGFVTAHRVPVINHWHFLTDKCQIVHVSTLRGHLETITSVALNESGATCLAGHSDGTVSLFRLSPDVFVRTFHCKRKIKVTKVAVVPDNSCIIVVQRVETKKGGNKRASTFLSLFEINGLLIAEQEICVSVLDCVVTGFENGLQTNLAFLLTDTSKIFALSMNSLKVKAVIDTGKAKIVALSLWKSVVLVALTNTNSLISWNLFDLSKSLKK